MAITHETIALNRMRFLDAYEETILWANTWLVNNSCEINPVPGDSRYSGIEDYVSMREAAEFYDRFSYIIHGIGAEQAGHDFALTRNYHGTGFWDRGNGTLGEMLAKECETYGEHNVYIAIDDNDNVTEIWED